MKNHELLLPPYVSFSEAVIVAGQTSSSSSVPSCLLSQRCSQFSDKISCSWRRPTSARYAGVFLHVRMFDHKCSSFYRPIILPCEKWRANMLLMFSTKVLEITWYDSDVSLITDVQHPAASYLLLHLLEGISTQSCTKAGCSDEKEYFL